MPNEKSHEKRRQIQRNRIGNESEQSDKSRVPRTFRIILRYLKRFTEKIRCRQNDRRTVHDDCHPALHQLCRDLVGSFGIAHRRIEGGFSVLNIDLDISGVQNGIRFDPRNSVTDKRNQFFLCDTFHIQYGNVRTRNTTYRKGTSFELFGMQTTAQKHDVVFSALRKALVRSADHVLRVGFLGRATRIVLCENGNTENIFADISKKNGVSRKHRVLG